MNRVFSIGPVETAEGEGYLLTLVRGELAAGVETGSTALEALRAIVEATPGEVLVASPELREEARALGLEVAPLPESIGMLRASQAFLLANGDCFEGDAGFDSRALISAVIDYHEAAPWRWLDGDTPVRIEHEGRGREAQTLEASVLGNAGEVFGLALYDRPGSVTKLARPGAQPTDSDVVLLTLDDEPSWAVDIMREVYGLPFVPCLARIRRNRVGLVRAGDLRRLEGALRAVAQLEPDTRAARAKFMDAEGRATIVRATVVEPSPDPAPMVSGRARTKKVSRNAMCPCGSGRKYKRCCLPKRELDDQAVAYVDDERARTESLVDRLLDFMKREEADHALRWFERLIPGAEIAEDYLPVLLPMVLYELPLRSGELLTRRYLDRSWLARRLTADERERLEASVAARFSIWEVLRIDMDHGLELVDMLTGERCFVHDIMASRSTRLRAGILARVVEHRGRRELDGSHPHMLRPTGTDAVVKAVRKHLGVRKKWLTRELLDDPEASVAMFRLWQAELAAPVAGPFGGQVAVDSQPLGPYTSPESSTFLALHLRHWRCEPNLSLDGLTPCEAVARAGSRRKLHVLLREAEYGLGEAERQVFAAMRAEIGLDELGGRTRVTNEIRMTAKISMRLTELATPLLMGATEDAEAEAILRVAAEVWNAGSAAGDGEVDRRKTLARARTVLGEHELEVDARELETWVDALVPLRRHYDDPRYMEIVDIEFGEWFRIRVAALLPRR